MVFKIQCTKFELETQGITVILRIIGSTDTVVYLRTYDKYAV